MIVSRQNPQRLWLVDSVFSLLYVRLLSGMSRYFQIMEIMEISPDVYKK